jgi:hypothetical protein
MKSLKMNSLQRLVAFVLITVLLLCVVGFAAGGWQSAPDDEPDSGDVGNNTGETDENTDGNNENTDNQNPTDDPDNTPPDESNKEPVVEIPKYYSTLTGLEISQEQLTATPLGFVLNPKMPLYGISSSDITLEFPTEDGNTRLLSYTTNSSILWKVGSLAPSRAFISNTSNFFGGIVISYGNDDIVKYSAWDTSKINLDISKISECYYIENTLYIYTSKDMIDNAMKKSSYVTGTPYKNAPYLLSDTSVIGTTKASSVILPYSDADETELYYSETSGNYLYYKSGARKVDMLNGKNISFTNVFVLFANTTTYENADGTELVVDTTVGGSGYYISKGYMTEIRWSVNEFGALEFKTLNGDKLTVNSGNAYIGYYKASNASKVTVN